jgi:hypothetical protein
MSQNANRNVVELCERSLQAEHEEHEEIIGHLQDFADPYSVPFLREAVLMKPRLVYLEYDDYAAYYKKCFWALSAIGTNEAIAIVGEFATSNDLVIKREALYRLSKLSKT